MTKRLFAGASSADVTPASSLPLAGYGGREGRSEGVHDHLGVRALVLSDRERTIGLVTVDLLNTSRQLIAATRRRLRDGGAEFDALTVVASHTHGAPYIPTPALDVHPTLAREYDATAYVESVAAACATALTAALAALAPAELRIGSTANSWAVENRRSNPAWGARIPRGGVDPTVTVLSVRPNVGDEIIVYNYPLHPVCTTLGENRITADWPGYAIERVRERRDSVEEVVFLNGAAGDLNPRQRTAVSRTGDEVYEYMAEIGNSVGDSVLTALEEADRAEPITTGSVHVDETDLDLPVKNPGPPAAVRNQLDRIDARLADVLSECPEWVSDDLEEERQYLREQYAIAAWERRSLPVTLTYVEVGPVGYLAVPAEVVVDIGRLWKDAAEIPHLLPVTYANDYVGYVPALRDLENGGYEVETCKISPEAIHQLRTAGVDLVSRTNR